MMPITFTVISWLTTLDPDLAIPLYIIAVFILVALTALGFIFGCTAVIRSSKLYEWLRTH